jgi:hypothetical protein
VPLLGLAAASALARCDAVVVVGGGMFGPGLPPLVRLLPHILDAAAAAGRAVAYVGIGVYTGVPKATLASLRRSTTRTTVTVTVRDRASATLLSESAPPPCVGDLAHHLTSAGREDARALLGAAGVDTTRPLLLLAPKAGTSTRQTRSVVDAAALAAAHWQRLGGTVAGIALSGHADHGIPTDEHDAALVGGIAAQAGVGVPVLGPNLHPGLARAVVAQAAAVVGHRFHGVVFAAAEGVPATAYAWEPKTISFLAEHGLAALSDPLVPQELEDWLGAVFAGGATARRAHEPVLDVPRQSDPVRPDQVRREVRAAADG